MYQHLFASRATIRYLQRCFATGLPQLKEPLVQVNTSDRGYLRVLPASEAAALGLMEEDGGGAQSTAIVPYHDGGDVGPSEPGAFLPEEGG